MIVLLVRSVPAHPPPSIISPLEHVGCGHRVQGPIAALSPAHVVVHASPAPRYLYETVVQAQVVPDRVLPALPVPPVVRELVSDVIVYLAERHTLVGRGRDGHGDQRYIRIRRFLVTPGRGNVRGPVVLLYRLLEQAGRCGYLQRAYNKS